MCRDNPYRLPYSDTRRETKGSAAVMETRSKKFIGNNKKRQTMID